MKNKKLIIFLVFLILNFIPQIFVIISQPDNLLNWYSSDDAFYYFKTAQNISEGKGITFDGLAPTNGFHPLWMIICVPVFALARFNLFLPLRVLAATQVILNAISGYMLFKLLSENLSESVAWVAALFWMFYLPIHEQTTRLGLETALTACMIVTYIYYLSKIPWGEKENDILKRVLFAGLFGIGVLFSRLDNIFLLIITGVWIVFKGKRFNVVSQLDFILIIFSAVVSFFIRMSGFENIYEYLTFIYLLIGLSLVIKPTLLYLKGCYVPKKKSKTTRLLVDVFIAISISSVLIFSILFILQDILKVLYGFSRAVVIIDWGISLLILSTRHYFYQKLYFQVKDVESEDISLKTNWRIWVKRAVWFFSPIIISLSTYLFINKQYAGTAMPVSGQIKRWWGTLPNTVYGRPISTLSGVFRGLLDPSIESGPFWLLLKPINTLLKRFSSIFEIMKVNSLLGQIISIVLLGVIVYFLFIRIFTEFIEKTSKLNLLPIFTGVVFHAISYKATGYLHVRSWYWMGEVLLIIIFLSSLLSIWDRKIEKIIGNQQLHVILSFLTCSLLWIVFSMSIIKQFPLDGQVPLVYDLDGEKRIFESQTKPGDVVGMTGGGLSAYFIPDRKIVNLDGLINSADYLENLRNGEIAEYLAKNNVKYIYGDELVLLDSDPYRWVFEDALTLLEKGPYFYFYSYNPTASS